MPYRQRPYAPGPRGIALLRTAVCDGGFTASRHADRLTCLRLNANGLLARTSGYAFAPTPKGIALIRERDDAEPEGAMA